MKWLKQQGGLAVIEQMNIRKATILYDLIDNCDFYHCPVVRSDRSRMNIPFTLKNAALDATFLNQAEANGLIQLKGHRSVGGMRASLYNAMPLEGVVRLVEFMQEFADKHG